MALWPSPPAQAAVLPPQLLVLLTLDSLTIMLPLVVLLLRLMEAPSTLLLLLPTQPMLMLLNSELPSIL